MIAFVVAHDKNLVIGKNNQLPWHLPEDLAYFKRVTMGKPMIMGRNTFESIGRPLPGRQNIVITRNDSYHHKGIHTVQSMEQALKLAKTFHTDIMVIGGASIFNEQLDVADTLFITEIHHTFEGDTFFPRIDLNEWELAWASELQISTNGLTYTYKRYHRKASE
ncbi:dihydrofolate reductase [Chryseomicrobium palamuruense]|uniref:Dihydrofolate reductase n=1 Tax=Chryseomicrobium palamuruense TaxID=682973 RepID=A0ABV8UW41_9BACL